MIVGIIIGSLIVVVIAAFLAFNAGKSIEKKTAIEKIVLKKYKNTIYGIYFR